MRRALSGIGLILLIAIILSGGRIANPQDAYNIKVDVAMVTADVTIIGSPAADLAAADFVIYDNGVIQKVSHFSRNLIPVSIVLLIDVSASIELPLLESAALSAISYLRPEDQIALFAFETKPKKLTDLTKERRVIIDNIRRLAARGPKSAVGSSTEIHGSIYEAAQYLHIKAPNSRRAIILISDNCQTASGKYGVKDAVIEMLEASATLYGVKISGNCVESSNQVEWMAAESGGEILEVNASTSLQAALEKAMSNLRLQYTLGFNPSNPGENGSFHKLTLKIAAEERCPGCRLLTCSSYYVGNAMPLPPQKNRGK